ncbi:MAG TPA: RNA-binding S4 domain-containing protein [Hansschlegelia sp.]
MPGTLDARPASTRLDTWLWRARVVKTRSLGAKLARSGHVRVNGRRSATAHQPVRVGDVLTIALERSVRMLRVTAFGERRGPATEARALFEDIGADG